MEAVGRAIRRGGLGLVAAADLAPSMRPLALDGRSLVGNDRVRSADAWPLTVSLELSDDGGWDQSRTWVLVAGGDAFTDRGVYDTVVRRGKGVDYPFDGGTARVTGHGCCDPVFNDNVVPRYELTGDKGVVRRLFKDAELAIANHEMPVTDAWGFHSSGLRFSGKPELTEIFTRAGIDWMSLANNHIKDYDTEGIARLAAHPAPLRHRLRRRRRGPRPGAPHQLPARRARRATQAARMRPRWPSSRASAWCRSRGPARMTAAARPAWTATWCRTSRRRPARRTSCWSTRTGASSTRASRWPSQRKHAARWVKAGADLVLGGHSHVAGAIEDIDGVPVLYSLGNLIFDQHWSTNTMESMLVRGHLPRGHARQPGAGALHHPRHFAAQPPRSGHRGREVAAQAGAGSLGRLARLVGVRAAGFGTGDGLRPVPDVPPPLPAGAGGPPGRPLGPSARATGRGRERGSRAARGRGHRRRRGLPAGWSMARSAVRSWG